MTNIEWTDETWNPTVGCSIVSPGCHNCYAMRMAKRLQSMERPEYADVIDRGGRWTGTVIELPERLDQPLKWKKPRRIFVDSMSDLFHESVSDKFIAAVFGVMGAANWHTFQVLTKRPERAVEFFRWLVRQGDHHSATHDYVCLHHAQKLCDHAGLRHVSRGESLPAAWPLPNVWLGVSCEDQKRADERIPLLLSLPAGVRFVSAEPLLGPIGFQISNLKSQINWVIVGGESGPGARECDIAWMRSIVMQCQAAGVAVFVKQLGAKPFNWHFGGTVENSLIALTDRKGGDWDEFPAQLRIREFPTVGVPA